MLAAASTCPLCAAPPGPGERIRLGIVSGFFCRHTVFRLFLQGWLTELDRRRFEVIGFHTGRTADASTEFAASACDRFVHGLGLAGRLAGRGRRRQRRMSLLYPEIGMDPLAARLAAQRLAPVQCVTWGHPDTTGHADASTASCPATLMEPPDAQAHYTERLVRLPNLGLCYAAGRASGGRRWTAPSLGLRPGRAGVLVGPGAVQISAAIRRGVSRASPPRSAAASSSSSASPKAARSRRSSASGCIARSPRPAWTRRSYCVILPPMPPEHFAAAAGLADVVLDTPGWSGGRSTLECLAQDPAIVTLPGRFMRGRHTAAILRRIGCEATIAGSLDEYVAIAARLGRDPAWRAEMRQTVARGKARAFRDLEYMRALEDVLENLGRGAGGVSA